MRILWFGRSSEPARAPGAVAKGRMIAALKAPHPRTDAEVTLALSTLPRYDVLLLPGPRDAATAAAWARVLAPALGERRAASVVAEAARAGMALVATCPRELAEHYRDALIRQALPCAIEPA